MKPNSLQSNIKLLVQQEPQCLRSYSLLVVRYWMLYDGAQNFADAVACTSPEAITRAFRDLVRKKEIRLPADIAAERKMAEESFRTEYGGKALPGFMDLSGTDI